MRKYNHAVTLAFSIISEEENGKDITPAMLKEALLIRIIGLDNHSEWIDATMPPYDTHEEEPWPFEGDAAHA